MSFAGRQRVFVALLPSEPARAALAGLQDEVTHARWAPPERLHLTLRFIGELDDEQTARVREALAGVRVDPFPLGVEGVGVFPPRGRASVLWAGAGRVHPFLLRLRQQVDDRLLATGVPFELRPFAPHFTLGRVAESPPVAVAHWLKRHRDFAGPVWRAEEFHLMASAPAPGGGGPRHETVERWPLHAAP